ncbi:MAG: anaerobic ribonucleoside-triphosphate reductase activating protein [Clostridia bacterium]|nr:anaerobic ribonucleoside-triphosphate reductase activating protein [Clostridia bacterium]MBQ7043428.1 anaerobic ribonucleoside-triphosphate reductase activating protein [Clostridia bacterium]
MKICGFQKMTMLDYPGKVACTVFTGGCNFRCPFCHNALLVTEIDEDNLWEESEIIEYLYKRKGIIDGVCITGGEPLMQKDIAEFIGKVRETGLPVKLDTNGSYPDKLKALVADGLVDYVAMDIKNSKAKYPLTVGIPGYDISKIEESVEFLLSDAVDYEFRTTVVKELHTADDIAEIADWIAGAKRYFLQGFVDSGSLIGENLSAYRPQEMVEICTRAQEKLPNTVLRGIK